MLDTIRNTASTFVVRILFGIIAFAFVFWGVKDVIQSKAYSDVVTFRNIPNISRTEFLQSKSEAINLLQKSRNVNLTEQEIRDLGIDALVLQNLIYERLIANVVNNYNLLVSDDFVVNYIKTSKQFQNQQGKFEHQLFKRFVQNSNQSEQEYLELLKSKIASNALVSILFDTFKVPNIIIDRIKNHMSEGRYVDIVEIDLDFVDKKSNTKIPDDEALQEFYNNNKNTFQEPEKRSFAYINIDKDTIINFLNTMFPKKDLDSKSSKEQQFIIVKEKLFQFLEDDVAAGLRLNEIAKKYAFKVKEAKDQSIKDVEKLGVNFKDIANNIFSLDEKEASYPMEFNQKNSILLVEMHRIKKSTVPELSAIKTLVLKQFQQNETRAANFKILDKIRSAYNVNASDSNWSKSGIIPNPRLNQINGLESKGVQTYMKYERKAESRKIRLDHLKMGLGIKVVSKYVLYTQAQKDSVLTSQLVQSIFDTKKLHATPLFQNNNRAYFAYVKDVKIDRQASRNLQNNDAMLPVLHKIKNLMLYDLLHNQSVVNEMRIVPIDVDP